MNVNIHLDFSMPIIKACVWQAMSSFIDHKTDGENLLP